MKNIKAKSSHNNLVSNEPTYFLPLAIIFVCIVAKLCWGAVSFNGDVFNCNMVADYWNFGKDLIKEKILYVDLIDHKGPYLFFLYAFLVFLSNNHIWIVALVDTLIYVATIVAFYWYFKSNINPTITSTISPSKIFNSKKNTSILFQTSIFALVYLLLTSRVVLTNTEGISAICLILIWGIVKKSHKVTPKMFFIIGIALGILFNFKITSIAIYFPFFVYACIKHIKNNKEYKNLLKSILIGILSFIAINIPSLIYMLVNNNLNQFIKLYNYACVGRNQYLIIQIIVSLVFLISGILYMFSNNDKFVNLMICLSSLALSFTFGNFENYYVAFYVVIIFLEIFQFKENNKLIVSVLITVILFFGVKEIVANFKMKKAININELAIKYEITNKNILYIWEDFGYGVYSNDTFVEPYQWVPLGIFNSDKFTEYYTNLTIERLQNKQFEYVFAPYIDMIEDELSKQTNHSIKYKANMNKMFVAILPYLKENYDCMPEEQYLYKSK